MYAHETQGKICFLLIQNVPKNKWSFWVVHTTKSKTPPPIIPSKLLSVCTQSAVCLI